MRRPFAAAAVFAGLAAASAAGQTARFDAVARIRDAAARYRAFGRVDDELRWAPWLCRMPLPSLARVSRAEAEHGRKVYFVYASDRDAYLRSTSGARRALRPGFTVVKESFAPRELGPEAREHAGGARAVVPGAPDDFTFRALPDADGRLVGPGEPAGLFIMQYVGARVRESDGGWIYGTVSAAGEVTAAGRLESCMGCHRSAPHGRLFGLGG
ncbi:MAG TPA: hypothetical protein VIL20_13775 [Sandaracinaceae bacterium]